MAAPCGSGSRRPCPSRDQSTVGHRRAPVRVYRSIPLGLTASTKASHHQSNFNSFHPITGCPTGVWLPILQGLWRNPLLLQLKILHFFSLNHLPQIRKGPISQKLRYALLFCRLRLILFHLLMFTFLVLHLTCPEYLQISVLT